MAERLVESSLDTLESTEQHDPFRSCLDEMGIRRPPRSMWRLEVRHNELLDVPEKAFFGVERSLWELDLQYNELTRIPRDALRRLKKLKVLDFTGDIQALYLRYLVMYFSRFRKSNYISDLTTEDFDGYERSLQTLVLAENSLTILPEGIFRTLENLKTLNLRGNNIMTINPRAFQGSSSHLAHINLANNLLTTIPFEAMSEVRNIQTLNLARNMITQTYEVLYTGSLSMDTLVLDFNQIESLQPYSFQNFGNINRTSLRGNPLTHISEDAFKDAKIKELYLHDCDLWSISEKAFGGLESTLQLLELSYNNLSSIPEKAFDKLDALRSLSLSNNKMSLDPTEAFNGFRYTLQYLNLLGDNMGSIPMEKLKEMRNVRTLGLSTLPDKSLSKEDFRGFGPAMEKLYLMKNGISAISGHAFEHVPGVKILDLSNNNIGTIDNEAFVNIGSGLEELRLSSGLSMSQLPPQPMQYLTNLKELDLSNNNLQKISRSGFSNLESLEHLDLEGNNIRHLEYEAFQNMPKLRYLDLSFNEMTNLNLDAFDQVGTLSTLTIDASHNRIPHLKLNGSTWNSYLSIKMIDYSHNNITWISRDYFESVRSSILHLWFHHNNLRNVSANVFGTFPHLQLLDFAHNRIEQIDHEAFRETRHIQYVNFRHNDISDLPTSLFENHQRLRHFDVSFNHLRGVPDSLFKTSPLEIFKARNNRFTKFPESSLHRCAETLRVIDLAYNQITSITDSMMGRFDNLVSIDVSHNHIKSIEARAFRGTGRLVALDVSHNPIKDLPGFTFDGLQESLMNLSVANTSLSAVPDFDLPRLMHFNVSHNILSFLPSVTMANLSSIRVLDISYNELPVPANSAWQMLPRLRELYMQKNPIRSLTNTSFTGLERLEILDIRDFPLQVFESGCFTSLTSLRRLFMTTHPQINRFNLARALHNVPSLQELILEVDGTLNSELMNYELPYRLTNITLMGPRMRKISPTALQELRARELQLTFYRTHMEEVPRDVFKNLGRVKYVAVAAENNTMTKLGEPSTTGYPGVPHSVFLTDLRMHNNQWNCDCGIGWIEGWLKKWRQSVCVDNGRLEEYLRCQDTVHRLRQTPCNNKRKSIMEALKTDLERGGVKHDVQEKDSLPSEDPTVREENGREVPHYRNIGKDHKIEQTAKENVRSIENGENATFTENEENVCCFWEYFDCSANEDEFRMKGDDRELNPHKPSGNQSSVEYANPNRERDPIPTPEELQDSYPEFLLLLTQCVVDIQVNVYK
ncbi:chaoptin-like [Penaeus indicus]|uniref:chaoptin-like n=1 Tax=Penaeus indicus TaxID=29960 RepID=UPI00300D9D66